MHTTQKVHVSCALRTAPVCQTAQASADEDECKCEPLDPSQWSGRSHDERVLIGDLLMSSRQGLDDGKSKHVLPRNVEHRDRQACRLRKFRRST
mmetsp:Transcript_17971/g.54115  ORF Transcript_17971/g.54115 Transcript_17971/m.54115 type:complete len:94 (+) Transcript_17971:170-451(+)